MRRGFVEMCKPPSAVRRRWVRVGADGAEAADNTHVGPLCFFLARSLARSHSISLSLSPFQFLTLRHQPVGKRDSEMREIDHSREEQQFTTKQK